MTTLANILTYVNAIANNTVVGDQSKAKITLAANMVLESMSHENLAYYQAESIIDVPAYKTIELTPVAGNQCTYSSDSTYFNDGIIGFGIYEDWYGMVIDHNSDSRTIHFNRELNVTSEAEFTIYPMGINLNAYGMDYQINGSQTANADVISVHGVYVNNVLITSYPEAYDNIDISSVPTAFRFSAPFLYFNYKTNTSFTLKLKYLRKPKLFTVTAYSGSEVLDFPSGWDYLFAQLVAKQYALLNRDPELYNMLNTKELELVYKSFVEQQSSYTGNLYYHDINNNRGIYRNIPLIRGHNC